jgi:hypothetical protein
MLLLHGVFFWAQDIEGHKRALARKRCEDYKYPGTMDARQADRFKSRREQLCKPF